MSINDLNYSEMIQFINFRFDFLTVRSSITNTSKNKSYNYKFKLTKIYLYFFIMVENNESK